MTHPTSDLPASEVLEQHFYFPTRCLMFLSGVLCPLIFIFTFGPSDFLLLDAWQDGRWKTKVSLLLSLPVMLPFLPGILFSIVSLGCLCIRPESHKYLWVKTGIYTGAILSTHFCLLTAIATDGVVLFLGLATIVIGGPIAYGLFAILGAFSKNIDIKRFSIQAMMSIVLLIALGITLFQLFGPEFFAPLANVILGFLGTPAFCAVTYVLTAGRIAFIKQKTKYPKGFFFILTGWMVHYFAAWQIAIKLMTDEYSKLPATMPSGGCFISSAAAWGHPVLVRTFPNQGDRKVNRQMQDVKILEFSLQVIAPKTHRILRRIYNRIGPKLASVFRRSPYLADLAFVAFLPFQFAGKIATWLSGLDTKTVRRMYRHRECP